MSFGVSKMSDPDKVPETNYGFGAIRLPPNPDQGLGFQPPPKIDLKEHEAKTARTLTYVLVAILGSSILLQYVALAILVRYSKTESIPNFEHLFNAVLPVLAGLTGSAVTYYLTKEKK
jgi:hypothetical protein